MGWVRCTGRQMRRGVAWLEGPGYGCPINVLSHEAVWTAVWTCRGLMHVMWALLGCRGAGMRSRQELPPSEQLAHRVSTASEVRP